MTIERRIAAAYLSIGTDSDFFCPRMELFYFQWSRTFRNRDRMALSDSL